MEETVLLIGLLTFLEKEGGNNFIDKAEIVSKYKASISDPNKCVRCGNILQEYEKDGGGNCCDACWLSI